MTEELKYTKWDADFPEKGARGKFAPKLQFADRMAWYTIYHSSYKVSVPQIAEAAGLTEPVTRALLSPQSGKYRNVKKEYERLGGVVGATQKYVEEHHLRRLREVVLGPQPIPKPNQIRLGGREFIVEQNDKGRWTSFDIELGEIIHDAETKDECHAMSLRFAKNF